MVMVQRSESTSITTNLSKTVYSVSCGNKSGTLHPERLGSGSKGKCIHCENSVTKWFTPKEFEKFGGRETSKDWKRSVKLDGKPFYFFLNSGELKIHAFNCYCQICSGQDGGENSDGANFTPGPIKFFCPPNRKRRAEDDLAMPSMVSRSQSSNATCSGYETDPNDMSQLLSLISQSIDNANKAEEAKVDEKDDMPECSVPVTSQPKVPDVELPPAIVSPLSIPEDPNTTNHTHFQQKIRAAVDQLSRKASVVEDGISSLSGLLVGMKSEIASLKQLLTQYEKATTTASNRSLPNDFKSAITDTLAQVLGQSELNKARKREDTGHCANCNRPAPFKCGRCNLVRYCSEFCQQRDWPIHNKICGAKIPATPERMTPSKPAQEKPSTTSSSEVFILEEDCEQGGSGDDSTMSNGVTANGVTHMHTEPETVAVDGDSEIVEVDIGNNENPPTNGGNG